MSRRINWKTSGRVEYTELLDNPVISEIYKEKDERGYLYRIRLGITDIDLKPLEEHGGLKDGYGGSLDYLELVTRDQFLEAESFEEAVQILNIVTEEFAEKARSWKKTND